MSRRPSVTIYDYPEDLNPFKDDNEEVPVKYPVVSGQPPVKDLVKDDRKKFWTFGRKKKQRSQSFSIKSTWNGLFGKKKDAVVERKPTIATVSTTYQRASYNDYPLPPPRPSRDHQEFNEALGTLARRRKYTLDNSSRYGSNLTMNGDPGRIYDGCPQETTASIMGDLTPKPPARRFGQVSPKPTDKIPPLDYGKKDDREREDGTPIPPKRGGFRSSQRLNSPEDDGVQLRHGNFTDENENEEFVFKRCSQDAVRKSNLSINSCISVGSVYASGRKKRRAPPPPVKRAEVLPSPKEDEPAAAEPLEIARVAEDISEMTKRTQELDLTAVANKEGEIEEKTANAAECEAKVAERCKQTSVDESTENGSKGDKMEEKSNQNDAEGKKMANVVEKAEDKPVNSEIIPNNESKPPEVIAVDIEYSRLPEEPLEIKKEVTIDDELILRRPTSTSSLPGGENFSVKEEIEKIEKQIQMLESRKQRTRTTSYTSSLDDDEPLTQFHRGGSRRSLQETRRHFFRDLTSKDDLQIEIKQLPREQSDIEIVRLNDQPAGEDAVQVIELHISEPIRKKVDVEINPIPKPRRCGAGQVSDSENDSI